MTRRKSNSSNLDRRVKSRRYYELWTDHYTISCALYRLAKQYLNRCEMAELIAEIMRSPSWAYTASALTIALNNKGLASEVRRVWKRYM